MNKAAAIITSFLLVFSTTTPAQAENEVKPQMKMIGKSFSTAEKTDDLATIKQELGKIREAAAQVQTATPDHLKDQPVHSADRKLFSEGIAKLLIQVDQALALATMGKLDETKSALAAIKATRNEYHKKLKP